MNTLLASILDCISPVVKSASLVAVAVTRSGDDDASFPFPTLVPQASLVPSFSTHATLNRSSTSPSYQVSLILV